MKYYVGIDLSLTGTGLVILDLNGNVVEQKIICTKNSQNIEERICLISNTIFNLISEKVEVIYIEGLSFGSKGAAALQLAGLHFYIRINLFSKKMVFEVIPPTTLKKFITGKGNCKKELILLKIFKKFGIEFEDNNLADAYVLARMAFESCEKSNSKK